MSDQDFSKPWSSSEDALLRRAVNLFTQSNSFEIPQLNYDHVQKISVFLKEGRSLDEVIRRVNFLYSTKIQVDPDSSKRKAEEESEPRSSKRRQYRHPYSWSDEDVAKLKEAMSKFKGSRLSRAKQMLKAGLFENRTLSATMAKCKSWNLMIATNFGAQKRRSTSWMRTMITRKHTESSAWEWWSARL